MDEPESELVTLNSSVMIELIGNDLAKIKQFQIDFLGQANEYFKKLAGAYNQNQFENLKEHAHFLKTSANAIGAEKTGHYLATIEAFALKKDKPALKELILKLKSELKTLAGEIRK
ncbi:MAG: Hpt domain-containing protein [Pseudomonadota bacterium]|uniref:Hpt domain-containing protein n=1 Tax=Pseudoalteromonas TaxID=53246 RepID=UPI00026CC301|nr:Hpt domain-containing protein [Pseudoalteromonas spongiae]ATC98304.1 hypothetical protein PSPO_a1186 [Pseudoalteromonas spongiae UST010723-006]MEC8324747.1 Hpt domain-containing protein [Pseudomonadota bacterium]